MIWLAVVKTLIVMVIESIYTLYKERPFSFLSVAFCLGAVAMMALSGLTPVPAASANQLVAATAQVKDAPVSMDDLPVEYQMEVVRATADLYAYNLDYIQARRLLSGWNGPAIACTLAGQESDVYEAIRLVAVVYATTDKVCP